MMSSEKRQVDYVRDVCRGKAKRFSSVPCTSFLKVEEECALLMSKNMGRFWKECRFEPKTRLEPYIKKEFKKYYNLWQKMGEGKSEDREYYKYFIFKEIDYDIVENDFKTKATLPVFIKRAKMTIYTYFIRRLRELKIKSHNEYSFEDHEEEIASNMDDNLENDVLLAEIIGFLDQRIKDVPKEKNARRNKYKRQYEIIIDLIHYSKEGYDEKGAKKKIIDKLTKTKMEDADNKEARKQQLNRDIREIVQFLKKKLN